MGLLSLAQAQSPLTLAGDTLTGLNVLLLLVASLHVSWATGSLTGSYLTLLLFGECLVNWIFFLVAQFFNSYCEIRVMTGELAKESEEVNPPWVVQGRHLSGCHWPLLSRPLVKGGHRSRANFWSDPQPA